MIIFFNGPGIQFLAASFGIACGLAALHPALDGGPFLYTWAGSLFVLDVTYRGVFVRRKIAAATGPDAVADLTTDISMLWPLSGIGGNLMFLPAWVASIVLPLFYVFVVDT